MLLAMSIGVAAVVVLTSLGEGARRYVANQFSSLGTHLLIVFPGRSETTGTSPTTLMGETPRDLTLDDARRLLQSRYIHRIAPISVGTSAVSWGGKERDTVILGTNADFLSIRRWSIARGRFLTKGDWDHAEPVCVIGEKVRKELFGVHPSLGKWLRIGDYRFRVIGILGSSGQSIGMDTEELLLIPVASAQTIFNNPSLFRILVEAKSRDAMPKAKNDILNIVRTRHQGEEDITVVTQDAVLATFDRIFTALTFTVAGIAAISLAVAGILIMNVMLVAVSQRTAEIGLYKALGARRNQIVTLFLVEAATLALLGGLLGGDGEILAAVAGDEHAADGGHHLFQGRAVLIDQIDFKQAFPVEQLQPFARRNIDRIVQVNPQHIALGLHHADYPIAVAADAYPFAQRVAVAEQFVAHFCPQDREGPGRPRIIRRQELTDGHVKLERSVEFMTDAVDRRAPLAAAAFHGSIALNHGHRSGRVGHPAQGFRIFDGQWPHAAEHAG